MKKKTLLNKLEEQRKEKQPARKGVVAVLAHKKEIAEALGKGFTVKEIHTVMVQAGDMPVGYPAFARLVKKYIKGNDQPQKKLKGFSGQEKPRIYNPDDYDPKKLF